MRAILLAAGLGTRLRPLTDGMPKCLVPIGGRPLLDIWLDRLAQAGIGPCLVNTHYLAEQVENFVSDKSLGNRVRLVHEPQLLGTAGTLIANLDFFGDGNGLLIHADNYCHEDLRNFVAAHRHRPSHCLMTMMTFRCDKPSSCGIVELNADSIVVGFHEKSPTPPGNLANGAVYALSAELITTLRGDWCDSKDFSTEVLPRLLGRIYTYETKQPFIDIGTPNNYAKANGLCNTN